MPLAQAVARARNLIEPWLANPGDAAGEPDLIDLFAVIYDVLDAEALFASVHIDFLGAARDATVLSMDEAGFRGRHALIAGDGSRMQASLGLAQTVAARLERLGAGDRSAELVHDLALAARAIDAAFAGIRTQDGTSMLPRLQPFQDRLARSGTLLRKPDVGGFVLPLSRVGLTGNTLPQLFANLARIPAALAFHIDYALTPLVGRAARGAPLRIGIAPVVVHAEEAEWRRGTDGTFAVSLAPAHADAVERRLLDTLDWFAEAEVDIVVLPELVSSERLRTAVRVWMRRHRRPGLVLAGTEAVDVGARTPANRAFMLGRLGDLLWTQDKIHRYTLQRAGVVGLNLTAALGEHALDEECFSSARTVKVRDVPAIGRCIILICQDLFQAEPGRAVALAAGADLVFAPIMDVPAEIAPWAMRSALDLATDPRATTVIANSYALVSRFAEGLGRLDRLDHSTLGGVRGERTEAGFPDCIALYLGETAGRVLGAVYGFP